MWWKQRLVLVGKYVLLVIIFYALYIVSLGSVSSEMPELPADQTQAAALGMMIVSAVDVLVIAIIIRRSRWHGRKLALTTAVAWYGVMTFLAGMEALYFGPALGITMEMAPALFLPMLITVALFTPLAVVVLGKRRPGEGSEEGVDIRMSPRQWAVKLAAISLIYLVLYFGFGYIVAWQNPALREMYGNGSNLAIFSPSRLFPLQLFRGLLWAMFGLPVIRGTKGPAWQVGIVVGLFFALPMNIVHVMPNPFMPDPSVRLSHFIETATSNFILGLIVTWLLHRRHVSLRDLFGRKRRAEEEKLRGAQAVIR